MPAEWPTDECWKYFAPREGTFWRWSADHSAIEWNDGRTIVFRAELLLLIESLAANGLPPLENILLTVAASRLGISTQLNEFQIKIVQHPMQKSLDELLVGVHSQLVVQLAHLPEEIRTSVEGRCAILAVLTENGPRLRRGTFGAECVDWLRLGKQIEPDTLQLYYQNAYPPGTLWHFEMRGLHDGLAAVNETAVRLRMKTGLTTAPAPAPIPLNLPEVEPEIQPLTPRQLLEELERDEEHAGLARLTRRLLSLMALPRPVSSPDDQPLGGVSDITNRGPFDRLLLSELAHDSDVLMTRLALNEAMYIRREVPPAFPPRERLVLVDAGIRMWGLPRLFSTASALALATMQYGDSPCRMYCATLHGLAEVDFTSKNELIEHLGRLEPAVHPGPSLPTFIELAGNRIADFVIITSEDVLTDMTFRRDLNELRVPLLYFVAVTREGTLRLIQRTRQGEKILREARLDLEQILDGPPRSIAGLRDTRVDPNLPAILRLSRLPLRCSHQVDWDNCGLIHRFDGTSGVRIGALLAVTYDRRLTVSEDRLGPLELSNCLPSGKLHWHNTQFDWTSEDNLCEVVIGQLEQSTLSIVTVQDGKTQVMPLELPATRAWGLSEHAGIFYVAYPRQIVLCSRATGKRLDSVALPAGMEWVRGRFAYNREGFHAIGFDGMQSRWHRIHVGAANATTARAVFDCVSLRSPVIAHRDGTIATLGGAVSLDAGGGTVISTGAIVEPATRGAQTPLTFESRSWSGTSTTKQTRFERWPFVTGVSADGSRLVLHQVPVPKSDSAAVLVDLEKLTAIETRGTPAAVLNSVNFRISERTLRNRYAAIGVYEGKLALVSSKGKTLVLDVSDGDNRFVWKETSEDRSSLHSCRDFKPVKSPADAGFDLKVAEGPNGCRAYLDSRGLLHLQSGTSHIPEMTFLLYDTNAAGWCDRNVVWGDRYSTGLSDLMAPANVSSSWLIPFVRRWQ